MARALIALGSNLGDRAGTLHAAITSLSKSNGTSVLEVSSFHETAPVGGPETAGRFLNAAVAVETSLEPAPLMDRLLAIETEFGRVRSEKNAPRTLDLDLLLYDDLIQTDCNPIVPHPRMHEREFVLAPLAEVAPEVRHPSLRLSIRELLTQVGGQLPSPFRLDGTRVMITGATSGIGKATALAMARLGADVLIHGRNEQQAMAVVNEIQQMGQRSAAMLADLSHPNGWDTIAHRAWSHWSGLDVWVNNAGADTLTGPAGHWPFEQKLEALWTIDVRATIHFSRIIGEYMGDRGRGCISNIGWDQAETGMDGDSGQLFGVSKGAVMAFTRSLAKSLAPKVRVNCVAPGWIKTAWGESASEHWQQRVMHETPMKRWGTPDDVSNAVCWLASPAASFVTGQVIRVNGGVVS